MDKLLSGLSDDDRLRLLQRNAMSWYNLDERRLLEIEATLAQAPS
jgi:hypothetical protein